MKIGVIRQDKGTEVCSTCSMETFLGKVKKENKGKYITLLRDRLPSLQGSDDRFIHLDKIPRIYPVAEFRKTAESGWKFKRYNGIVLVEVNRRQTCPKQHRHSCIEGRYSGLGQGHRPSPAF